MGSCFSISIMPGSKRDHDPGIIPATIIRVKLYCDVDAKGADRVIEKVNPHKVYTAEELCTEAAGKLDISPLMFHLFALCTPDLKQWLPPNHEITCPNLQTVEYVYRMRLRPSTDRLTSLWNSEASAFSYLYMQVRDDFVNDRLHNEMNSQKQDAILGLCVLDMVRYCMERNLTPHAFSNERKTKEFIPKSTKTSFRNIVDKQRLNRSCMKMLEDYLCKQRNENLNVLQIKWKYIIIGIWNCVRNYGVESFTTVDNKTLEVDPSGNLTIKVSDDKKEIQDILFVENLMDMNVKQQSPIIVFVKHNDGGVLLTKPVPFESMEKAVAFEAIMKGRPSVNIVPSCANSQEAMGEEFPNSPVNTVTRVQITAKNGKTQEFKFEDKKEAEELKDVVEHFDSLEIVKRPAVMVHINHSEGKPLVLGFQHKNTVDSLVSLLDSYHRLTKDYHHHLCRGVESPMIVHMNKLKCHGPVTSEWSKECLTRRNHANSECNFLLKQSRKMAEGSQYVLYVIPSPGQECVPVPILNVKDDDGRISYQVKMSHEPAFPNMTELLEYYMKGSQPKLPLKHCVPPSNPMDDLLFVCRPNSVGKSSMPADAGVPPQKAKVDLVSVASALEKISEGFFTEVFKGMRDSCNETEDTMQAVAIKQLKQEYMPVLQYLLHGVHQASFWTHPTILTVHAVCLSPQFRVIMELADLGSLDQYLNLSRRRDELRVNHLVIAAEQIGQALVYLQEEKKVQTPGALEEVHGNIRCRNILVFYHDKQDIKVKLADPGMVHIYNSSQPLSHHLNIERLPWLAPECFPDLKKTSIYSDRYAFGITVWEMFAAGDRPFSMFEPSQIIDYILEGCTLPKMDQMPPTLYQMICQCWNKNPMKRIGPRDMVKEIRTIRQSQGLGEYGYTNMRWEGTGSAFYQTDSGMQRADNEANEALERHGASNWETNLSHLLSEQVRRPSEITLTPASPVEVSKSLLQSSHNEPLQFSSGDSLAALVGQTRGVQTRRLGSPPVSPVSNITQITTLSNSGESRLPNGADLLATEPVPVSPSVVESVQKRPLPSANVEVLNNIDSDELKYTRDKPLGSGHYGEVRKATFRGKDVAVKCLKAEMYEKYHKEFEEEFKIMVKLKHERIVDILGMCPQRDARHPILLVMEYVTNGCLRQFLRQEVRQKCWKKNIGDFIPTQIRMAKEVAEGMVYLSSQNPSLIHRDLAARNVLVTEEEHMKISDFGMARVLAGDKDYYRTRKEIPLWWCPYEAIAEKKFTTMSDVWSYGVTVWEIFSFAMSTAFCAHTNELAHSLKEGKRLARPENCPDEVYKLLKKCWEFHPVNRPTFPDILRELQGIELLYRKR